jgi:glyoxylase-like metal-dependent hydrolase (beta-lactamase superfamily II)
MSKIKELYAVKYGESDLRGDMMLSGGDPNLRYPIDFLIYLLRIENRRILIDAGCLSMPGWEMRHFCSPTEILERIGVRAEEISDVILTHAHHDHAEALALFPRATVYVQKEVCLRDGGKYIPKQMRTVTFADELWLFDCLRIVKIGGHARGSSVVELYDDGKPLYVMVGDECYGEICFEKNIPTGASAAPEKSRAFLDIYRSWKRLYSHEPILPGQNGWIRLI